MKKHVHIAALCLLALLLLAGCEKNTPTTSTAPTTTVPTTPTTTQTPHTCDWGDWMMDGEYHWKGCSICGEKYRYARHDLDEKNKCADCKVKVTVDDQQHTLLTLQKTYRRYPNWEKAYDAEGRLYYEATYSLDNKTQLFTKEAYYYNEDGTWEYALCDDDGWPTKHILYDTKGNVKDTYTYTYKYWDSGFPSHINCSLNGVLIYQELYSMRNSQPFRSRRTDYRPDGSYTVAEYNDDGDLTDYKCYNADGSGMDHTGRYDREAARPLVGSWSVVYTSDTRTMGMLELEARPIDVLLTYTFDLQGNLLITQDLDPEQHFQYRYDVEMQELTEWRFGMYATLEEKEAACQQQYGMSLHDYAVQTVSGFNLQLESHRQQRAIYFIEEGLLYIADSWVTLEESIVFVLFGDTLTLRVPEAAAELPLKRVEQELPDYSDRFDPEACAPLYGTWTGTVKLDSQMLGLGESDLFLLAQVTVTFDEKGSMTMVLALDPEEFRNFALDMAVEAVLKEYPNWDRARVEQHFQTMYRMTIRQYVTPQVTAMNPIANAVQEWTGVYFVENGQLYSADPQNPEAESSSFTLEGDKLTMTDPETGLVLELTKLDET